MKIGRRHNRLIVERPVNTRDETTGEENPDFTFYAEVWAAIEPLRGRELLRQEQILADLDTIITVQWSPNLDIVTSKWRLRHAEKYSPAIYNIFGPPAHIKLQQHDLQFLCKSGVNSG